MKNIGISKGIWRELNKIRREQNFNYYNDAIEYLLKRPSVSSFEEKSYDEGVIEGYAKGKIEGYVNAKNDWQLWFFCNTCGERMDITPDSNVHEEAIKHLKRSNWGHSVCHRRVKEEKVLPHSSEKKIVNIDIGKL